MGLVNEDTSVRDAELKKYYGMSNEEREEYHKQAAAERDERTRSTIFFCLKVFTFFTVFFTTLYIYWPEEE